jgi:diaminopimelate epimerase
MLASEYSGCGNTFVIIDDRTNEFPDWDHKLIASISASVDGCILVRTSKTADFQMKYFNNDGKEAALCGNGLRCFARFVQEKLGFSKKQLLIETKDRLLTATYLSDMIQVEIGAINDMRLHLQIPFQGKLFEAHHIHTGVPHLVIFVNNLNDFNVQEAGTFFRYHPLFHPHGVNVNFVEGDTIRTYERGVERETLACGTGAVASALILHALYKTPSPIALRVRSKEILHVSFDHAMQHVMLSGNAHFVQDYNLCSSSMQ